MLRVGFGYDQHKFTNEKKLIIGGVQIAYDRGLHGHSDGDVLLHAICDSLLGALGRGDIGELFPDTDNQFKDADSSIFLRQVMKIVEREGFTVGNLDSVLFANEPEITPYKMKMKERIAELLNVDAEQVNIKATRSEGFGSIERLEGIAAQAVVVLIEGSSAEL